MTMFIKLDNGKPTGYAITEDNLRSLFPTLFPVPHLFTPAEVENIGYGIFEFTNTPIVEYPNKAIETAPVLRDNGIYYQTWIICEMSDEEKAEATSRMKDTVRFERDNKLLRSDWTQLADAQLNDTARDDWRSYRQELRDITMQAGFPWTITWPTEPGK